MDALIAAFFTSLVVTYLSMPSLIKLALRLNLLDVPENRSSHSVSTPFLGGIAIFGGTFLSVVLFLPFDHLVTLRYMLSAYLIMFMLGARDDVEPLTPSIKMAGQILVSCALVFGAGIRLTSLYGMFGVWDISYTVSILLTIFTLLVIINAVNLIDGIDALCSSFGLLSMAAFGTWFYLTQHLEYAVLATALAGALISFLRFNFTPAKIFMGDTGSLFIGLTCAIMAITFIEFNGTTSVLAYKYSAAPAIAMAVLILPLSDLLRVFIIRLLKRKSPFAPDRNHLHHILTDLGYSHIQATLMLLLINVLCLVLAIWLHRLGNLPIVCVTFGVVALFSQFAAWRLRRLKTTVLPA